MGKDSLSSVCVGTAHGQSLQERHFVGSARHLELIVFTLHCAPEEKLELDMTLNLKINNKIMNQF